MPTSGPFSLAQLVGYAAFGLGVVSFLQKDDRRLKTLIAAQAASYALHFLLLGSTVAALASVVTSVRALLSLVTRSPYVGGAILIVNLVLGALTAEAAVGWLPVAATSAGTVAFFWFRGLAMRAVLLGATLCWLINNFLLGSIGGTLLEVVVGVANASTCYRIWQSRRAPPRETPHSATQQMR